MIVRHISHMRIISLMMMVMFTGDLILAGRARADADGYPWLLAAGKAGSVLPCGRSGYFIEQEAIAKSYYIRRVLDPYLQERGLRVDLVTLGREARLDG